MDARLTPAFLKRNELNNLHKLRARGPTLQAHLDYQQRLADKQDPEISKNWFNAMKNVMEEIDQTFGGFSSYILSHYPLASGTGISLPTQSGGHACLLEDSDFTRYFLIWADVTSFQLGTTWIPSPYLQPFPFPPDAAPFNLVILDGHPLRTHTSGKNVHLIGDRLIISSLVLGLFCVAPGGTIILKLSMPDRKVTAQIIYMLDMLAEDIRTWKPVNIHATRSTFYVIAKNIGGGKEAWRYEEYLKRLKELWEELMFGGDQGWGRMLESDDLNFIVTQHGMKSYVDRYNKLCKHIWEVEAASLAQWHEARRNGF
uniref:Ribosomal RNA methyltransferase FtsJ domain-containing protein n=1 Tax=Moniliophthora roreri TaxID=221103 RepID=A0A0W0F844_MONRR